MVERKENKENKEITKKEEIAIVPSSTPLIAEDMLIEIAKRAEERLEAIKKIKLLALRITNQDDWTDFGGKPYLESSGAEKIARLFGISWQLYTPEIERKPNGHYRVSVKGVFTLGNSSIEVIGIRESDDPFFAIRYQEGKKIELPPDEVDLPNVIKSAITNCIGQGIVRLLGIRNLTWEELEEYNIRKPSKAVSFKKATTSSAEIDTEISSPQPASQPQSASQLQSQSQSESEIKRISEVQIKYLENFAKKKGSDVVALEAYFGKPIREWSEEDFKEALKYLHELSGSKK